MVRQTAAESAPKRALQGVMSAGLVPISVLVAPDGAIRVLANDNRAPTDSRNPRDEATALPEGIH
jgi:hypothetical protein